MTDERAVDEGLMIASAALTMAVKNAVIVGALRDGVRYDSSRMTTVVRDEILDLAGENKANSERLEQLSEDVLQPGETALTSEHYSGEDSEALAQRSEMHDRVSAELKRLSDDDDYLASIAEKARRAAWAEVGEAIESRLDSIPSSDDPFYNEKREARIRELLRVDLKHLESKSRRRLRMLRRRSRA